MQMTGFKTEAQAVNFLTAGVPYRLGGALAVECGARTRNGGACHHLAILEGKGRCLKHGRPVVARAFRARQLRQLITGRTTPEEFACSDARRARNRLQDGWKRNPSLPGQTIDLGANLGRFDYAASAFGVDVSSLLPAVRDWLSWRFQRTQIDRQDSGGWTRAVRQDLPRNLADAERAMVWVRAGGFDKRTKAGRALKVALRSGVEVRAAKVAPKPALPLAGLAVRLWRANPAGGGLKRAVPDNPKRRPDAGPAPAPARLGRPRRVPDMAAWRSIHA